MDKISGITYKNKHSYNDFCITIKERNIGYPTSEYIAVTIPYMHGFFDFTDVFGETTYEKRELKYVFNILGNTLQEIENKATEVINWLKGSKLNKLEDDTIKGFYFEAQAQSWEFKRTNKSGELTVTFQASPFKIRNQIEGNTNWDDFIFTTDTLQQVKFTINDEEKEIELINNSAKRINPYINCDTDKISIILEDKTEIEIHKSDDSSIYYYLFELEQGLNKFKIKGTGTIEFIIRNEVL